MSSIFTFNHSPPKPASPWLGTPSPSGTPQPVADDPEIILDDVPGHLRVAINSGRVRGSFVNSGQPSGQIMTDDGEIVQGLEAEPQIGSTEYKLSLSRGGKNDARLEQLTTQLLWRLQQSTPYHATSLASKSPEAISTMLQESSGALYEIGVADDGTLVGLDKDELEDSIEVLRAMAAKLGASVTILRKVYVRTVEEIDVKQAEQKLAEHILAKQRTQRGKKYQSQHRERLAKEKLEGPAKIDPLDAEKFHIPKLGAELWVVEALVEPFDGSTPETSPLELSQTAAMRTEELRISLTGPTTCGKSTLLGTLSTGELDNGRGKSRLSLLKHRHELVSGVTSSITQELFGYRALSSPSSVTDSDDEDFFGSPQPAPETDGASRVVNYATGNISSWTDIHSACEGGRVVFVSDSAGHLKYSRTTVRSLVGWDPHYAALLIAANDCIEGETPGLGEASQTHIELCLKLGLRLVIIFTKIDLASKLGLKEVFSAVLSTVKAKGRKPLIVKGSSMIDGAITAIAENPDVTVPIIFSSAVRGDNIKLVHELLMKLPIPERPVAPGAKVPAVHPLPGTSITAVTKGITNLAIAGSGSGVQLLEDEPEDEGDTPLSTLFHIEEVYGMKPTTGTATTNHGGSVVSGHVRYGKISIGDRLLVGPFSTIETTASHSRSDSATPTPTATPTLLNASHPHLLSRSPDSDTESHRGRPRMAQRSAIVGREEWRTVKVISVRHLRLPVTTLMAGEAGTIGVVSVTPEDDEQPRTELGPGIKVTADALPEPIDIAPVGTPDRKAVTFASPPPKEADELLLKRGLVFLNPACLARGFTRFTATLEEVAAESLVVGSDVTVYIASVRAVARILEIDPAPSRSEERKDVKKKEKESDGMFGFDDSGSSDEEDVEDESEIGPRKFKFEFSGGVEWIQSGAQVLVMKTGGGLRGGIEVFVGNVVARERCTSSEQESG